MINDHLRPSQLMQNTAPSYPGAWALFCLGRERFNFKGHEAYRMPYPGRDIPPCWEAYRAGIRSAEFGWSPQRTFKELQA